MSLYFGCSNNQSNEKHTSNKGFSKVNYHKKNFDSLMSADKNLELDYYEELLNDKVFVDIFEHSALYLNYAKAFLSNDHFNPMQVEICICAMQNLDGKHYIDLCKFCYSLYNQNKITSRVLEDAIGPDFLKKRIIIDNYNNPDVIALLDDLMNA